MPFQLSPGVSVVEKDFSSIVPTVSSSTGAFAGPFAWGPVEDPVRISSETELVSRFGLPNDANYTTFLTAANFLAYTNSLFVCRTDAANLRNAVVTPSSKVVSVGSVLAGSGYTIADAITVTFSLPQLSGGVRATGTVTYTDDTGVRTVTGVTITNPGSGYTSAPTLTFSAPSTGTTATAVATITVEGVKIKNVNQFLSNYAADTGINGAFAAKFPGTRANGIRIVMLDAGNWSSAPQEIKNMFNGAPGTSEYAEARGISDDEMHIVIIDTAQGTFSGSASTTMEKFSYVSKLRDAKSSDGTQKYWKGVINAQSKYVWALSPVENSSLSIAPSAVSGVNTSAVFAATGSIYTITISDSASFDELAAYKAFYDTAVDKTTLQIAVSGTTSNNKIFNVTNIAAILNVSSEITSYIITVAQAVTAETATSSVAITSVAKAAWNSRSEDFNASVGAKRFRVMKNAYDVELVAGTDDFTADDASLIAGFGLFSNTDEYDISLIPTGNVSANVASYVINLAGSRRDCVAFVSPNANKEPILSLGSDATNAILDYRNDLPSSSYGVIDSGFKYQYDRYKDVYRWVPLNGDIAGLCARTDFTADPWFSPGGYTRGQIKNIVKLAFNPSPTDRDILYPAGVNPVVTFPGQGTVLFGDKTLLAKPSAFDRINVRRLFIVLEKSIATAAKFQLFEFNDSFTRAQFRNLVEPFLRDVQGRRGVSDFRVKCDESNNPGEIIDRNEFVADIFIKPNRSINYITLNFVAARSSVSFEEIGA